MFAPAALLQPLVPVSCGDFAWEKQALRWNVRNGHWTVPSLHSLVLS